MDRPEETFTVAVIRAWLEPDVPGGLRVRMVRHGPGPDAGNTIGVAGNINEACEIVERWLLDFLATAERRALKALGTQTDGTRGSDA